MMKKHFSYIAVLCSILLLGVFSGCNISEVNADMASSDSSIKVVGRVTPFQNIDTKSVKSNQESKITNMAMLVVDGSGAIVETQFVEDSKPLFIIDRSSASSPYSDDARFEKSRIFIIANIPYSSSNQSENKFIKKEGNNFFFLKSDGSHIGSIDDFLHTDYIVQEVGQPSLGFPMYGVSDELNLKKSSPLSGEVLEIPLTCLYSKVVFNLSVAPIQTVDGVKQRFTLTNWTVHNVPAKLRVEAPGTYAETVNSTGDMLRDTTFTRTDNGLRYTEQKGKAMTFSFYMPEHKINPGTTVSYPTGMTDDDKQRFKPKLISEGQKPTYVTIHGIYTDHNSHDHEVSYDVYLGENNRDNFYINRDCQLNNNVYIKGITNTSDGTGISLDWRVNVTPEPFTFSLERETLLDSHWEIRPIRISFDSNHADAKIQVEILNSASSKWIRMEKPSDPDGADYCFVSSTDLAYGKRKYFTTDLVSNTLQANTQIELSAADGPEQTVWVYVDENTEMPETDGSTVRSATVQCRYYENGYSDADNPGTATVSEDFTFRQRSLHRITYGERHYGIEYYEEYLYNFDSKDNYDVTTDGMAWGLDGVQLSYEDRAIYFEGGFFANVVNSLINSIDQNLRVYDFYLSKAESADGNIEHPYSGNRFTKRISNKVGIGQLATNANASSAVEYCVNKNKRNSGTGKVDEILWYLPAIDEMEEICKGGYSSFEVFQDKYYWSAQPAYQVYNWSYRSTENNGSGQMYLDNKNRARATKVDNSFGTVDSGQDKSSAEFSYALTRPFLSGEVDVDGPNATGNTPKYEPGNQSRTAVNRIRCAYRILKAYTSTFGFESGTSEGIWASSNFSRNNSSKLSGNYSGRLRIQGGWLSSTTETATVTSQLVEFPQQLSFHVMYSGDTPSSSTWTVSVSSDNSNWTQVSSFTTLSKTWVQVPAIDLSSLRDVYIRIQNSTTTPSGDDTYVYIDDITLSYKE